MVYLLLGNGFEETEAIAPLDCLRRAGIPVTTLGIGGDTVVSAHQVEVRTDRSVEGLTAEDLSSAEMVILPGGLGGVAAIQGSDAAVELILTCQKSGGWLAAICAAPAVLGKLGLLTGKKATVYPGMQDGLVDGIHQPGAAVVVDGKIITGEAAGSAWAFGLTLVTCLRDREAAEKVAGAIHYHGSF